MTQDQGFVGEEAGSGHAPPILDLIASAFLIVLSVAVMIGSVRLEVPDSIATAPGLLPFVTAGSMAAMTLVLAWGAWKRYRMGDAGTPDEESGSHGRTAGLAGIVALYIAALEYLSFEYQFRLAGMWLKLGSFELISIIVITGVLAIFWRAALWRCFGVALVWIVLLASAFRYIFAIPLPGAA